MITVLFNDKMRITFLFDDRVRMSVLPEGLFPRSDFISAFAEKT